METWTIRTDDGGGHLELHSFREPAQPLAPGRLRTGRGRVPGPTAARPAAGTEPAAGVVLVHGTLVTDALYRPFARNLSRLLGRPVHCYNRRGRAGSSPQPAEYSAATEVADLAAVLRQTGSTDVFAHSYGGFVALQAARSVPIRRLVTYDAAVSLAGSLTSRWRPELERSVAAGELDQAWALLVQGLETAGPVSKLPLGALRMLSILSARTPLGGQMRELLPTAVAEMRAVLAADAELADFAGVTTPALLLTGGWSPGYFAETGRQLAAAVPAMEFGVVPGQLHEGPLRPANRRLALVAARFLMDGASRPARTGLHRRLRPAR
ncbi:alpha/beta fold hydrolase [Arthrobacter sp. Soil763]|uniref:alpha/beta fold hydrolase n=1 Tax=Arthrobacter sp. Soil763 TaxID=1736402 RepID=UPI0006F3CFB2|nr:alpha/beta hydrolase [Arthrobacter sp. Soil763]KRE81853.1 alpha/beta hydrolase [Arthrobacter sp. Soil763]